MVVIVLTGGIGSGKSVASEFFGRRGAFVIDLDELAARAMGPESPALVRVVHEFGAQVLQPDGSLDRRALAQTCFVNRETTERLDRIVHPAIVLEVASVLADLSARTNPPEVVVVQVPLLAEAPVFAELGDLVVAIAAPVELRTDRAVARGMERSDVVRRARVQAPDSARSALADVVIPNEGTLDEFIEALGRFWNERFGAGAEGG